MMRIIRTLPIALGTYVLAISNSHAFGSYGKDVDEFCQAFGTTPYQEQGCDLCHAKSKSTYVAPQWDWWWDNDLAAFCLPAAMNEPPVLDPIGNHSVNEGELLQFMVKSTDSNGDNLSLSVANLPTGASFTDHGDGTANFSWMPTYDQAGNYPVSFIVTDDGSPAASASEQITITTGNMNRPPELSPIGSRMVNGGEPLTILLTAHDPDADNLSFAAANLPTGASLFDNGDGTAELEWTPTMDQAGNYPVLLTVTDDGDPVASDSEEITVTIMANTVMNRPPMLDPIGNRMVNAGEPLDITLTAKDPDGDQLSFTADNLPTDASFSDNGNGTAKFSWTPTMNHVGNHPVSFLVTDDGDPVASESKEITVTVMGNTVMNRPPMLDPIGNRTARQGEPLMVMLTASDPDGDELSFTADNMPMGADFIDNKDGTAKFSWTPAMEDSGDYPVAFTVIDDGEPAESDSEKLTFTVEAYAGETTDLYIHKAKVNAKKATLDVKGKHAPSGKEVMISDADSGMQLGTTVVRDNGNWKYKGSYSRTPPCRIRVDINGQYGEYNVDYAPKHLAPEGCLGTYGRGGDESVADYEKDRDDEHRKDKHRKDKHRKDDDHDDVDA